MLSVFEGLLPIFLLIASGLTLNRLEIMPEASWRGLDRLGFYFLMPCLLFHILYTTDFTKIPLGPTSAAFLIGISIVLISGLLIRKPVQALLGIDDPSYSSLYQGFSRWNGFIALAIVEKLFDASALTVVAIGLAVMVMPINVFNISVVAWLGKNDSIQPVSLYKRIFTNPLVLAAIAGILLNLAGFQLYQPLANTVELISRATLPIGIVLIGAGLKLVIPKSEFMAVIAGTIFKLLMVPAIYVTLGIWLGVTGEPLVVIAICGAVPTAMAGYVMASQMGGNAPLMAAIVTAQTVVSFFTIPLVVEVTSLFAGLAL